METNSLCSEIVGSYSFMKDQMIATLNRNILDVYWRTGKMISEYCKGEDVADHLALEISGKLSVGFGWPVTPDDVRSMVMFYRSLNSHHLIDESLSWEHYKLISRVENRDERKFYVIECSSNRWSVEELEKRISAGYCNALYTSADMAAFRKKMQGEITPITPASLVEDSHLRAFCGL